MTVLPGHWYALPVDPLYYNHAACSQVGENIRFFDSLSLTSQTHGNAICSVDCLLPQKNAILPLISLNPDNEVKDCDSYETYPVGTLPPPAIKCNVALTNTAAYMTFAFPAYYCNLTGHYSFTNIQAGNFDARIKIFDITFGSPVITGSDDFGNSTDLYNPTSSDAVYGGSLYSRNNSWLNQFTTSDGAHNIVRDILDNCTVSDSQDGINAQQTVLNYCRAIYSGAYGSTVVGYHNPQATPSGAIPPISTAYDRIASTYNTCQYVLDVVGDPTTSGHACPLIETMCRTADSSAVRGGPFFFRGGQWNFALASMNSTEIQKNLQSHLCQATYQGQSPAPGPPGGSFYLPNGIVSPQGIYFAGLEQDVSHNGPVATVEPQSGAGYIYRSCALGGYEDTLITQHNCCANDFADGEGDILFHPTLSQPPQIPGDKPDVRHIPLFGFDYATNGGTPWYINCFDSAGITCDPAYRDITGPACSPLLLGHCAGTTTVLPDAVAESWSLAADGSGECTKWLARLLYGAQGEWIQFVNAVLSGQVLRDRTGTNLSSPILSALTSTMSILLPMKDIANSVQIGNTPAQPLSAFQVNYEKVMFTLYNSYNLNLYDNGSILTQCGAYSIEDVVNNPLLRRWCGCMLSPASYGATYNGISIECTPTCNSSDVLQYGSECQGSACIIDDITVAIINSTAGSLSLSQVCLACGKNYSNDTQQVRQTCQCDIGHVNITAINSSIGNTNINEVCGLTGNGGGSAIPPTKPVPDRVLSSIREVTQTFPYTALAVPILLAIMALVLYLASQKTKAPLWRNGAIGMSVGALIIAIIIFIAILWNVIAETIWGNQ